MALSPFLFKGKLKTFLFQLEEVMEKETYKKAKEILEKFDPARFKNLEVFTLYI